MVAKDLVKSFNMPEIGYPTVRGTLVFRADWLPNASPSNRYNRGNAPWKNAQHIVLQNVETEDFIASIWEELVKRDWNQPSIQKLYKQNADGSYSMYDADRPSVNGPVMKGPLAKVLLSGIIGRPILVGEYARCGFRLIDQKGSWLLGDVQTLTTKESGDSTHLKTKSIPVLKIKQGIPDERKINGHLRYYEDAICHIDGNEYYLTKEFFDASFDPLTSFFKDRNVSLKEIVEELNRVEKIMYGGELGPVQKIVYGAPGTGKSKGVNGTARTMPSENVIRTTFHPDSDYSTFVGAYKPTMVPSGSEKKISYEFVPQAFAKAYVQAWKMMANPVEGKVQPVMLVIEEINRGDCAKVFGDLFQLLDRRVKDDEHDPSKNAGFSEYPVLADSDLADYVRRELTEDKSKITEAYPSVVADDKLQLILPPNFYIWATMNTSDQSLFPMDSAFKRRWDWKYVPISKPDEEGFVARKILVGNRKYDWWDFISIINSHIGETTKSEDKQLGYFFVKAPDDTGVITEEQFVNKVLFYLYNDVFKDYNYPAAVFERKGGDKKDGKKYAFQDFFYREKTDAGGVEKKPGDIKSDVVMEFLSGLKFEDKVISSEVVKQHPASGAGQTPAAGSDAAGTSEPEASSGTDSVAASEDVAASSSTALEQQQ